MPRRRTFVATLAAASLCSACVVVPVTVDGFDPDCRVVTHHLELQTVQIMAFDACRGGQSCDAAVLIGLGVTAASAVISSSIVVVGNVVYWADHRASCPAPAGT